MIKGLIVFGVLLISHQSMAARVNCTNNKAAQYPCEAVDLLAELNLNNSGIQANGGNDIWGWTDPETNREYAIMGMKNKTSFVDVTDPESPVHLADLKTQTFSSQWRDVKVYKNHAFIVSEAWNHGMQVYDLTQLRNISKDQAPKTVQATVHYNKFGNAHNVAINEDSGYAYAVGTNTCDRGAHVINIQDPTNPQFATCIDRDVYDLPLVDLQDRFDFGTFATLDGETYTHDIQCVTYSGPDSRYSGKELCVASNENTVNIVDVTDKANAYQITAFGYQNVSYTHQGWLTEDHRYFLLGDELDEQRKGVNTTSYIFDLSDLENPSFHGKYVSESKAIDHNMYVKGNYVYQANYNSGLRILSLDNIDAGELSLVAHFDTDPSKDSATFEGVWSVYPYFSSGTIVVSHIGGRLYVLKANLD